MNLQPNGTVKTTRLETRTITKLAKRILNLIPENQEILHMTWSGDLSRIPGYKDDDLPLFMFRNVAALSQAVRMWREKKGLLS